MNNAAETIDGLQWVACANELNAAYAADGYARVRGAAMLSTTYGVGELSALNGVMAPRRTRLPVFHIVGMPSERIQHLKLITHHNLGDTRYDRFQAISSSACCVSAVLTPDNCITELERVIGEALRQSMPAYLVISQVNGQMPVIGRPVGGERLAKVTRQRSDPNNWAAAVDAIAAKVAAAGIGRLHHHVDRPLRVTDKAVKLVGKANLPVAITLLRQRGDRRSLPHYIGLYAAGSSQPPAVREIVEQADLILDIGGLMLTELNTALWAPCSTPIGRSASTKTGFAAETDVYLNVAISDVLDGLSRKIKSRPAATRRPPTASWMTGSGDDPTGSPNFYPRLQRRLKAGDTLVIETGSLHVPSQRDAAARRGRRPEQGLWGRSAGEPRHPRHRDGQDQGRTWLVTGTAHIS